MAVNNIEILLKKKIIENVTMLMNDIEIFQKMKNKGQFSIEKTILKYKK